MQLKKLTERVRQVQQTTPHSSALVAALGESEQVRWLRDERVGRPRQCTRCRPPRTSETSATNNAALVSLGRGTGRERASEMAAMGQMPVLLECLARMRLVRVL